MIKLLNRATKRQESVPNIEVLKCLYLGTHRVPTPTETNECHEIKRQVSSIDTYSPLYDKISENTYLVKKDDVINRVVEKHYRFPTKRIIERLKEKRNQKEDTILKERANRKIDLMMVFFAQFDIDTLYSTYKTIVKDTDKGLTDCERVSYSPELCYIRPYYTKSEINNLCLNIGINTRGISLNDLCVMIRRKDVGSETIIGHQKHIMKTGKFELVQYYSAYGSTIINTYLRHGDAVITHSSILDSISRAMWAMTLTAPALTKECYVYRFLRSDNHIANLAIGDIFIDKAFSSTSRNPFYNIRKGHFEFGIILMKIKLPANITGVALSIEAMSYFPCEEEIIIPPLTKLRLIAKNNNCQYFHTDSSLTTMVKTRYEFEYVSKSQIFIPRRVEEPVARINLLKIAKEKSPTLCNRLISFIKKYCGSRINFMCIVGESEFNVSMMKYNSTGAYSSLYAIDTKKGVSFTSVGANGINFIFEVGVMNNEPILMVNYYTNKILSTSKNSDSVLIKIAIGLSRVLGISTIRIYGNFMCGTDGKYGNYRSDIYNYVSQGKRRFRKIDSRIIRPSFSYNQLDKLGLMKPSNILNALDEDELYQLYKRHYKPEMGVGNVSSFYKWVVDNYRYLSSKVEEKISRLYEMDDPLSRYWYTLDTNAFLVNNGLEIAYGFPPNSETVENFEDGLAKHLF